jgi:hypothetical protein
MRDEDVSDTTTLSNAVGVAAKGGQGGGRKKLSRKAAKKQQKKEWVEKEAKEWKERAIQAKQTVKTS